MDELMIDTVIDGVMVKAKGKVTLARYVWLTIIEPYNGLEIVLHYGSEFDDDTMMFRDMADVIEYTIANLHVFFKQVEIAMRHRDEFQKACDQYLLSLAARKKKVEEAVDLSSRERFQLQYRAFQESFDEYLSILKRLMP